MARVLGKVLLVAGLAFQAWNLYTNDDTARKFNNNFDKGLKRVSTHGVDLVKPLGDKADIIRLVIAVHYALSILMLFTKSSLIKLLVILGVILNTAILTNPLLDNSEQTMHLMLQNVAILGGLFYLLGTESWSTRGKVTLPKAEATPVPIAKEQKKRN